jgi:hypothetical protein
MNRATASLTMIVFVALMAGYGFSLHNPYASAQENETATTATNTDPNVLKGSITSLQDDNPDDNTEWIAGGVYRMENLNSASPTFNASFYMVRTDGNASHTHDVYDFVIEGEPMSNGNHTVFNGTSTVTMREGPITDVPTTITLLGDDGISIFFDPSATNNHFGNTAVYGTQHLVCVESPQYCE